MLFDVACLVIGCFGGGWDDGGGWMRGVDGRHESLDGDGVVSTRSGGGEMWPVLCLGGWGGSEK